MVSAVRDWPNRKDTEAGMTREQQLAAAMDSYLRGAITAREHEREVDRILGTASSDE